MVKNESLIREKAIHDTLTKLLAKHFYKAE